MKRLLIIIFFILFFTSNIFSQVYLQWANLYTNGNYSPTYGYRLISVSNNLYSVGVSAVFGRYDMALLKYSTKGNIIWSRRFDTLSSISNGGACILADDSGNLFVGGTSLWKYDMKSNLLWNKQLTSGKGIPSLFLDKENYILMSSEFANNSFLIRKYSYSGDSLWEKRFKPEGTIAARWKDAAKDNEDNIITAGYMNKPGIGDVYDFMTVKFSSDGDSIWANRFDQGIDNLCYAMTVDDSNNVYVTGNTQNANYDMVTIKYSPDGSLIWQKIFNGGSGDTGYDIEVDKDENVYVAGRAGGLGLTITKYDKNGNVIWFRNRPDNAIGNFPVLRLDKENSAYMAFFLVTPQGGEMCAIEKYDTEGNPKWLAKYGIDSTTSLQKIYDFFIDSTFSIYATGRSKNTIMTLKFVQTPTSLNETNSQIVKDFYLSQNYPNPFNPSTIINYNCSMFNFITLKVYDVLGNEVATLVNENKPAGSYKVEFSAESIGRDLASGIYFYSLSVDGVVVDTKRMVLLR
ncbi:MAG TPA: T9SS type A sorting domain-containing protein [Ignavibacteria bacterium]|nr:T9SS type A sorting domain-containing protein [Ignavibacteria bacterium]HMR39026.1 T9SS type A sorting domain-containing protein [Ignavibacteria bacterium]